MLKKYLILIVLFVSFSNDVIAQGGGDGPPPPGGGPGGGGIVPPRNPIDGGLGVLFALGIGYAIKKIRKEEE
jgi:hypothetical protein